MTTDPLGDPLRSARDAVRAGRFRTALHQLENLQPRLGASPEWLLLHAMASWRVGLFEESRESALRALQEYRDRGDGDGEMRSWNVAAAGAFALGDLESARRGFQKAARLAHHFDDKLMIARCHNNLGNVFYYEGDHESALHYYSRATMLFEHLGSLTGTAESWHNTAVVLREQQDLESAAEAADKALDAAERLGDPRALGWTLGGSGETDALRGDLQLGWARAERAGRLAHDNDDRLTEIDSLRVMAYIARHLGRNAESTELAQRAASLARDTGNPWMTAKSHHELGLSLLDAGERDAANAALAIAADAFETTGAHERARLVRATANEGSRGTP